MKIQNSQANSQGSVITPKQTSLNWGCGKKDQFSDIAHSSQRVPDFIKLSWLVQHTP